MLQGMNRIGQSWAGRIVIAIMFGFLIISFAIWGIGDIFRGGVHTQVATVGGSDISGDAFRTAYQTEYQNLIRRTRQSITPEQARALGLEQRVLGRLVTEAAFDRKTRDLGLAVSDRVVARSIEEDPTFHGANGAFDKNMFEQLLRNNGLSEGQFVNEQRSVVARQQLAEALTGDLPVPLAMREAVHRYRTETRSASYLTLGPAVLGTLPDPTDAQLQSFFDERKTTYRAPEYRAVNVLDIEPANIAKPGDVSDPDAHAYYERNTSRFGTAEKRTIQQIVFPTKADAEAAYTRIKGGETFDAVAKERNVDDATLNVGTVTKAEIFDPATAEAAFSLGEGAVSAPVDGRFGPVLVRVTKIDPASIKPFDEVADRVRQAVAVDRAKDQIQNVHDAIEDQRAGATSLGDIAKQHGVNLTRVEAIDRQGDGKDGKPVEVPDRARLLQAAFQSDVGADTEALSTPTGGYVWFEVKGVEPAHDRTLAEVKDRIGADWRRDQITQGLEAKAKDLAGRLAKGETLDTLAGELGLKVETASGLQRNATSGDLTAPVVTRIFATPVDTAASAEAADGKRVLFNVTGATVPPFITTTQEASDLETQLRSLLAEDVLGEYVADVEKQVGVQVYPENLRRAIGGET